LAVVDLPAGRTITESDVMTRAMTPEDAAKEKFPPMFMDKLPQITGRTLKQPLKQGRPFEPTSFYPLGMGPDPTESLQPGERAITLPFASGNVDETFVVPGSVVDVLFRANPDPSAGVTDATVALLSRVRVLAVGKETLAGAKGHGKDSKDKDLDVDMEREHKRTVTFAVTQAQARALKVVEGRGSMTIVLRSKQDNALAERGGPTTLPGLLGLKEPVRPFVSEIYRRGQLSTATFVGGLRQKITLDPPYGLPVSGALKEDKANLLEVWPYGWGWGGRGGYYPTSGYGGQGSFDARGSTGWGGGWGGGWGR
jgi:Flp pilus assembly protein CpaB